MQGHARKKGHRGIPSAGTPAAAQWSDFSSEPEMRSSTGNTTPRSDDDIKSETSGASVTSGSSHNPSEDIDANPAASTEDERIQRSQSTNSSSSSTGKKDISYGTADLILQIPQVKAHTVLPKHRAMSKASSTNSGNTSSGSISVHLDSTQESSDSSERPKGSSKTLGDIHANLSLAPSHDVESLSDIDPQEDESLLDSGSMQKADGCMAWFLRMLAGLPCFPGDKSSSRLLSGDDAEDIPKIPPNILKTTPGSSTPAAMSSTMIIEPPTSDLSLILSSGITSTLSSDSSDRSTDTGEFTSNLFKLLLQIQNSTSEDRIHSLLFALFFMVKNPHMSAHTLRAFNEVDGCEILLKVCEGQSWDIRVFCGMIFSLLLQSMGERDLLSSSKDKLWRIYKLQRSCVVEFDNMRLHHRGLASKGIVQMYKTMTVLINQLTKQPNEWITPKLATESVKKIISDKWINVNPEFQGACFEFLLAALSQGKKPVANILIIAGVVQRILRNLKVDESGEPTKSSQMLLALMKELSALSNSTKAKLIAWCQDCYRSQNEETWKVAMHVKAICDKGHG